MTNFPLIQFLDTNGDGTGDTDMAQDFSVVPGTFFLQPPSGQDFECSRFIISVTDKNIESDKFGGIAGGLVNGIEIQVTDLSSTVQLNIIGEKRIRTNADWMFYTRHVMIDPIKVGAGKASRLLVEFDFTDFVTEEAELVLSARSGIFLKGQNQGRIEFIVSDDLSSMDGMSVTCVGMALTSAFSSKI